MASDATTGSSQQASIVKSIHSSFVYASHGKTLATIERAWEDAMMHGQPVGVLCLNETEAFVIAKKASDLGFTATVSKKRVLIHPDTEDFEETQG